MSPLPASSTVLLLLLFLKGHHTGYFRAFSHLHRRFCFLDIADAILINYLDCCQSQDLQAVGPSRFLYYKLFRLNDRQFMISYYFNYFFFPTIVCSVYCLQRTDYNIYYNQSARLQSSFQFRAIINIIPFSTVVRYRRYRRLFAFVVEHHRSTMELYNKYFHRSIQHLDPSGMLNVPFSVYADKKRMNRYFKTNDDYRKLNVPWMW